MWCVRARAVCVGAWPLSGRADKGLGNGVCRFPGYCPRDHRGARGGGGATWRRGGRQVPELYRDAEVVVQGELVAVQHLGPGEAIGLHERRAAGAHGLAQRAARVDGPV